MSVKGEVVNVNSSNNTWNTARSEFSSNSYSSSETEKSGYVTSFVIYERKYFVPLTILLSSKLLAVLLDHQISAYTVLVPCLGFHRVVSYESSLLLQQSCMFSRYHLLSLDCDGGLQQTPSYLPWTVQTTKSIPTTLN